MTRRVVFVDAAVAGAGTLAASVDSNVRLVWLDPARDALQQMSAVLAEEHDLAAVEIVSHGDAGRLLIGTSLIAPETLSRDPGMWAAWRDALAPGADLLLYGCNVASTPEGRELVATLAELTGADVAASDDLTGSAARGGDWDLEVRSGSIEARSSLAFDAFESTLAVIIGDGADNNIPGTGSDDTISGLGGNDTLTGDAGNDVLDGGTGADSLAGGSGDDVYVVDGADSITENAAEGTDTVQSSASATLGANVEHLTLTDRAARNGVGNDLANYITGSNADNVLDGGVGADTLAGGFGNDTYYVDALDTVIEAADAGQDTVWSSVSVTLSANVEDLILTGAAAADGTGNGSANNLLGNSADNVLDGGAGADTLRGGAGNDTYVADNVDAIEEDAEGGVDTVQTLYDWTLAGNLENLTLVGSVAVRATGNERGNVLQGNALANVLDGASAADTMLGGAGDDTYVYDAEDTIQELANEGRDTQLSSTDATLATNVEVLTLAGSGALRGTGNAQANTLNGNTGANVLDGGGGVDTLAGGAGDDIYIVDTTTDTLLENADEGTDTVRSTVTVTLAAHIENLELLGAAAINGTGNAEANRITGTNWASLLTGAGGNDTLDGNGGRDTLLGGTGDDTYVNHGTDTITEFAGEGTDTVLSALNFTLGAELENLRLTGTAAVSGAGNALANRLEGNSAANELDGGAGADTMAGGAGDDTYHVDGADTLIEASGGGIDRVLATTSVTLAANLEHLTLSGDAAADGTGNWLANALTGNADANALRGSGGNDTLTGGAGADTLEGGAGADLLAGGLGDDVYIVDRGDVLQEGLAAGSDTVRAWGNWTLGANLENLQLLGTGSSSGAGNGLANAITGNAGNNLLVGAGGSDTLAGGGGNDVLNGRAGPDFLRGGDGADAFVFDFALSGAGNTDTVLDFTPGTDVIRLDDDVFRALQGATTLGEAQFHAAAGARTAHDASDRIIYNTTTGALYYDADGTGSAASAIKFAVLGSVTHPELGAADFVIVG